MTDMPRNGLLIDIHDRVATVTLNDPARRNAITEETSEGLADAIDGLQADERVHAIIVTGAGKAFCAGADHRALDGATERSLNRLYAGFLAVADCQLPTIAAVNGPAVGAGLNLALACDVRIAGPNASFDPRFQQLGIHPGGGITWMLQRAVGPQLAKAALLFGLRMDAAAAVEYGLALACCDDALGFALDLAANPAKASRAVVLATKATMRRTAVPGAVDSEEHAAAVQAEVVPQAASIASPEFVALLARARRPS